MKLFKIHLFLIFFCIFEFLQASHEIQYNFNEYLGSVNFETIFKKTEKDKEIPVTVALNKQNDHTILLQVETEKNLEEYLFIALSTQTTKKNLPREVIEDLQHNAKKKMKSVLTIYRKYPDAWYEIASSATKKKLNETMIKNVHIKKIMIKENGDLTINYHNIPRHDGEIIKNMNVTYEK